MKVGNENLDKRKRFFKKVVTYSEYSCLIQSTNHISWITVFEEYNYKITLGISETGKWVLEDEREFYVLNKQKDFLYCSRLLEVPYEKIAREIISKFKSITENEVYDILFLFPFFEIVEFAFVYLLNDYWFDLAWIWYEKLSHLEQHKLLVALENISESCKFSQKNRQKARKEVKKLKTNDICDSELVGRDV